MGNPTAGSRRTRRRSPLLLLHEGGAGESPVAQSSARGTEMRAAGYGRRRGRGDARLRPGRGRGGGCVIAGGEGSGGSGGARVR
jgi:hypothetical protein